MSTVRSLFLMAAMAVSAGTPASAVVRYTITDLGVIDGAQQLLALGLSGNGTVSGTLRGNGPDRGFVWTAKGGLRTTGFPGIGAQGGVSNDGTMVGSAAFPDQPGVLYPAMATAAGSLQRLPGYTGDAANRGGVARNISSRNGFVTGALDAGTKPGEFRRTAFRFSPQTGMQELALLTDLPNFSGNALSIGYAVNSRGDVAGASNIDGNLRNHAVKWIGDGVTLLDDGGPSSNSIAWSISENGLVAGSVRLTGQGNQDWATFWGSGTTPTFIPRPSNATYSQAFGVNSGGFVVGEDNTAFIWHADFGRLALNTLISPGSGWNLLTATAINDAGQIVGFGFKGGAVRSYFLNPLDGFGVSTVPEPASWAMLIAGFGLVGAAMRRRKDRRVGRKMAASAIVGRIGA